MTLCSANNLLAPLLVTLGIATSPPAMAQQTGRSEPLAIQQQGSFAVGGTVIQNPGIFDPYKPASPAGQTFRGDHAYAFFQIPVNAIFDLWVDDVAFLR